MRLIFRFLAFGRLLFERSKSRGMEIKISLLALSSLRCLIDSKEEMYIRWALIPQVG